MDIWWIIMNLFNHISSQSGSPTSHKLTTWLLHQISSQSARHQLKIWLLHHISSQSPPPPSHQLFQSSQKICRPPLSRWRISFPTLLIRLLRHISSQSGSSITSAHTWVGPMYDHDLLKILGNWGGETDHRQTLIGVCADIHKKCSQSLHKTTASPYTKHSQWVELLSSVILVSSWARVIKQHHLSLEGNRTFTIKNSISLREL